MVIDGLILIGSIDRQHAGKSSNFHKQNSRGNKQKRVKGANGRFDVPGAQGCR